MLTAGIFDEAGVPVLLVGDSAGNNVLVGHRREQRVGAGGLVARVHQAPGAGDVGAGGQVGEAFDDACHQLGCLTG